MKDNNAKENFLPDFCGISVVFALVVSAELLAIVLTLGAGIQGETFWSDLSLRSLYTQWITLATAGVLCITSKKLQRLPHARAGMVAWLILLLIAAVVSELAYQFSDRTGAADVRRWQLMLESIGISGIIGAVVLRYLYEQFQKRQQERAESHARFQALQARIRPHFLFNSMNTIASLTRADPALAEEVVQDLSDLFRASLGSGQQSTLQQELELARGYLRIEQQRLGERLKVSWELDEMPANAQLPPLMLQPLLENAIYHGIEPAVEGGEVRIIGHYHDGIVKLDVCNSLPPDDVYSGREGNHMALDNVRQRLASAFGDAAGVTVSRIHDTYQAQLYFPAQEVP